MLEILLGGWMPQESDKAPWWECAFTSNKSPFWAEVKGNVKKSEII